MDANEADKLKSKTWECSVCGKQYTDREKGLGMKPQEIEKLWSEAIKIGFVEQRPEVQVFAELLESAIKLEDTRADGWISVLDRLPTLSGNYLVFWLSMASQKHPNICSKFDVLFWTGFGWGAPITEKSPILFWMPLPAPPDTGEE